MKRVCDEIEIVSGKAWEQVLTFSAYNNEKTFKIENPVHHARYSAVNLHLFDCKKKSDSEEDEDNDIQIPKRIIPDKILKPSDFYKKFIAKTESECLEELKAPQKSEKWIEARKYCITASQFGSAIGVSPYQTPEALVIDKTWYLFKGNAACDWGTEHEEHAKESFCNYFKKFQNEFTFKEENLIKFEDCPWIGVSPDGFVEYLKDGKKCVDLVEFKCPAYLRNTRDHPYAKWPENTPPQYYAQIQGIMGYLNDHNYTIEKCWFVVWQPHQTWITTHDFNKDYYLNMYEKLKLWYFEKLLPSLTHKYNGLLDFGEIYPTEEIVIT